MNSLQAKPYLRHVSIRSDADFDLNQFPYYLSAVQAINNLQFHPDVTFFVGENGSGKSTVLEAIAIALGFSAEGGTKNVRFQTADTISPLHSVLRLAQSFKRPADGYFCALKVSLMSPLIWIRWVTSIAMVVNHCMHAHMVKRLWHF